MGRKKIYIESHIRDMATRFTPQEIANLYHCSVEQIYQSCQKYKIKCVDARFEFNPELISSTWLIEQRRKLKLSHNEFARQLGITPRLLESWMYERELPQTYRRIISLAMETLQARKTALYSKLRTGRQKSNPRLK